MLLPPTLGAELIADGWAGAAVFDLRLAGLACWSAGLCAVGWRLVPWTDQA